MSVNSRGDKTQGGIKSIEVGARVLFALEEGRGPMTLSQVAAASGLHPSKAHRYLASLMRVGLASQDPTTSTYDLGSSVRQLGIESLRRIDPVRIASARATELCGESGHTVNVSVWGDYGPMMVAWSTGTHALPLVIRVGSTLPLLDSAVGHCFLAHLPRKATAEALRTQQRRGETRKLPAAEVESLRERVRADGYGRTTAPIILGLSALAAPAFGADGAIALVVGMILPAKMMTEAETVRQSKRLLAAVDDISQQLGHRSEP